MAIKKSPEYKRKLQEIVKQAEGIEDEPKKKQEEEVEEVEEINIESDNIKDTIKQLKKIDREQNGTTIGNAAESIVSNKKLIKIAVIIVAVLIFLVLLLFGLKKMMINYTFDKVARGDIVQSLNYDSKLETNSIDVIASTVDSTVKGVYYKNGDNVKKGQLLLEFDPKNIENITSVYETAREDVNKMLDLYNRRKDELTIKAPCDGYITDIYKKNGEEVAIGDILAYYVATTTFRAEYKFTYTLRTPIEQWQRAEIQYGDGKKVQGIVYDIQGTTNEGQEIIVGIYVADSPENLSNVESTAEVITNTGSIKSNGAALFSGNAKLPIMSTQNGKISNINITEGKKVAKDDVLYVLDNVSILNKINELESNKSSITNFIESNYTSMNRYKIYSNVDGKIDTEPLTVGENIRASQELIRIKVSDEIRANIKVTSADRDLLKIGDKVEITTTDMKDEIIVVEAQITNLEEKVTDYDSDKKYDVTITINDGKVTKEMVDKECKVRIPLAESKDTLYVPKNAIVLKEGKSYVHIATSKEDYKEVEVKVGISSDTNTEILEGIEENQTVRIYKKQKKM